MTSAPPTSFPGALVISLDVELQWGVRDRMDPGTEYVKNLHGARRIVPRLLKLFEEFDVAATWAIVGFLFAESREDLERFKPALRPAYRDVGLSPYEEAVGENEEEDPLHYAPSLIREIETTPGQEIATHTYSHYYCGEEGQDIEAFRADLTAAREIAAARGVELRSIVFPRNQHNSEYDRVLKEVGIRTYRGNPRSSFWRFSSAKESKRMWKRAARFLDGYFGVAHGTIPWSDVRQASGLSNVRASCFLPPYRSGLRLLEPIRLARMRRRIRDAAHGGEILHLWWHPHNFGVHSEENLAFLGATLREFARCREEYGMQSLSMVEVDEWLSGESTERGDPDSRSGYREEPSPRTKV